MGVTFPKRHGSARNHGLFLVLRFISFVLNSQDWSLAPHALCLYALRPIRFSCKMFREVNILRVKCGKVYE